MILLTEAQWMYAIIGAVSTGGVFVWAYRRMNKVEK